MKDFIIKNKIVMKDFIIENKIVIIVIFAIFFLVLSALWFFPQDDNGAKIKNAVIISSFILGILGYLLNQKNSKKSNKQQSIKLCTDYLNTFKNSEFIKKVILDEKKSDVTYKSLSHNEKIEFEELLCYLDDLGYMKKQKMIFQKDLVYLYGWYITKFLEIMGGKRSYNHFPDFNKNDWRYCRTFMEEIDDEYNNNYS